MIHPHTELKFISPAKGFGVVATKLIPKGTITWVLDPLDQVFSPQSIRELDPVFREIIYTYSYRDKNGNFVLCWDHSRFINHSFHSNCLSTAYNFELAIRDILPGEELTDDYGYLNLTEPFNCLREEGTHRQQALPDDLLNFYPIWDSQLIEAFKYFNRVDQPLQSMIEKKSRLKVQQVAYNPSQMDSILTCYYPDPTYSTRQDYAR
jgi:uncharacterized protein (DUF433 family)